jgi:tRNA(fMet)-specific endonuclease VapC
MYLLDNNICVALLKNNAQAVANFNSKSIQCYLSTIVIAELYKGVYCSMKIEQNLNALNQFINLMPVVDFDLKASVELGKIQGKLRKIGKPTGEVDAIIATVARSRNDILVTNNVRHFISITNLQLENWLEL